GGVPEVAVSCPGAELDLGHQLRANIAEATAFRGRKAASEGAVPQFERCETGMKVFCQFAAEASADTADIMHVSSLIHAQGKRAYGIARDGGGDVATDDEFLALRAFGLYPVAAAAGAIGGGYPLRDDAL